MPLHSLWRTIGVSLLLTSLEISGTLVKRSQPVQKRGLDATLGLNPNHLQRDGIALGFLPALGESVAPNNCTYINSFLPQPMSIVGVYAQIRADDTHFSQLDYYLQDIYNQTGGLPVMNLALMPVEGFEMVTQDVADAIANKMAELNNRGLRVWLRYAHEMNGDWYSYGVQPEAFKQSWEMVASAVHAVAPETYMFWAPNSLFADNHNTSGLRGGYDQYWPTPNSVDLVGLSFYTYGGYDRLNIMPPANMAINVLKEFDSLYGSAQGKSVVLAETGAAFTYDLDWTVGAGNTTEQAIKFDWLWQILGPDTIQQIPSLKAVTWFEVVKVENAGGDSPQKIEDFRLVDGKSYIRESALNFLADQTSTTTGTNTTSISASASSSSSATNIKISTLAIFLAYILSLLYL